ncbi:trypsin-like peptidase domain-containing protein [Leptolyngbya sp. FACHB-321]|uniref:trypsin-like peptidase domain-containing protein n=1 Tax=Leptolyngbya sp. FACHB-321 TaxID=2692807 RepID=UPI001687B750|nr:trypsin-like peptidase domain-containing protein [Leptolyngbya sp. FACHB-321]MBD2033761.1 trypsin-like peptidase domain-containing protein [Leptolyngbya sp. FACHB-321]
MKLVAKTFTALNTLALALVTHAAFALDPATLYQRSSPAVVSIAAQNGKAFNYGSGFIADSKGFILTNHHVVGKNKQVAVKLTDGSIYSGIVVSRNAQVDLALVQIRPKKPLPSLRMQTVPPRIGQKAYAIGDPKGLERSLSDGIISRIDSSGLIQFTATASFGSSGGPLLDEDGQVIGIVRSGNPGTNLNFAIPAAAAINNLPGQRSIVVQQIGNYTLASSLQIRQGNYQKGLKILDEGIRRYPNNATLYLNRGAAKSALRDYQGAKSDYSRSIQLQPTSLAYSNRAKVYTALKQQQQALEDFTEAIRLNQGWGGSNLGAAFYSRGELQVKLGNTKSALSDFKQAAKFYQQIGNADRYRAALDQLTLISAQ